MKAGHCNRCPKRTACTPIFSRYNGKEFEKYSCPLLNAELHRIESPRRVARIEIEYFHDLPETFARNLYKDIYGDNPDHY